MVFLRGSCENPPTPLAVGVLDPRRPPSLAPPAGVLPASAISLLSLLLRLPTPLLAGVQKLKTGGF